MTSIAPDRKTGQEKTAYADPRTVLIACARELAEVLTPIEDAKLAAVDVDGFLSLSILVATTKTRLSEIASEAEAQYTKLLGDTVEELMKPNLSGTKLRHLPAVRRAESELRREHAIVARCKGARRDLHDLLWTIRGEVWRQQREASAAKVDSLPDHYYSSPGAPRTAA